MSPRGDASPFGDESKSYLRFAAPQNLNKYFNQLEGVLDGLVVDRALSVGEIQSLQRWRDSVVDVAHRAPFRELVEMLDEIFSDGVVEAEEIEDLKWLVRSQSKANPYYDAVTSDIQRLHGMMAGVLADGRVTDAEIRGLAEWVEDHEHLRMVHPYEELYSLLTYILEDNVITNEERALLRTFINDYSPASEQRVITYSGISVGDLKLNTLCSVNVDVQLEGRTVCFTGRSSLFTRRQLKPAIEERGGHFSRNMSQKVDYLVVGHEGNPCWAFAKMGRKIQQALDLRKQGSRLAIIKDEEFVDSIGWYETR